MASLSPMHYRRIGTVTAERLTEARYWKSSQGSELISQPGDWWVTSPDGGERGVAASEFEKLYEHRDHQPPNVYQRRGTVLAYQATAAGSVRTLEGTATFEAGDWIVAESSEHRWPVPDEAFRRSYSLIDD